MSASQSPGGGDFWAEPRSIDLREYWLMIRRRWVLVLVVTMLGAVAGLGYAKATGKSYSATAQVVVVPGSPRARSTRRRKPTFRST